MTHHPIKTLPDGTRVYSMGQKYKPMADEDRTYKVRKPDDPRAVRWGGQWFLPLAVLDDEQREMPETIPDDETLLHKARCRCRVCRRPGANDLWRIARQRRSDS